MFLSRGLHFLSRPSKSLKAVANVSMSTSATTTGQGGSNGYKKRPFGQNYRFKNSNKKHKRDEKQVKQGSNDEVLLFDVQALLKRCTLKEEPAETSPEKPDRIPKSLPETFTEIELTIDEISSTGDGLAYDEDTRQVYVVPFSVPGDRVTAKVIRHLVQERYSVTDFVKVISPGEKRDDSLINCKYFSTCSGCQFQMLSYDDQLVHKKSIVEKAYKNFSGLDSSLVPNIGDTIGSPLQYGYRTKLTPHFDGPPGGRGDRRHGVKPTWKEIPPIGFMLKGTRHTIDIEDCPIGTDAVRLGMKSERKRVNDELDTYQRGATLLLRENTTRIPKIDAEGAPNAAVEEAQQDPNVVVEDFETYIHAKSCTTNPKAKTTEYVSDFMFQNPAGAFFQNNNSILPPFTQYVRDHILPPNPDPSKPAVSYFIDAYSGSGLFTITLSSLFKRSIGIDISAQSIEFAATNAQLNKLPKDQASFLAADAGNLFQKVTFPAEETVVVIDPPRKGCDDNFLSQLVKFGPERVIYVSCNVHTQARDVGLLVGGMPGINGGKGVYELESLRGFDFFPQTGHVEGVAVLKKKIVSADVDDEEMQGGIVESEEVKSEEVKSEKVKSEEVMSQETKSEEITSATDVGTEVK